MVVFYFADVLVLFVFFVLYRSVTFGFSFFLFVVVVVVVVGGGDVFAFYRSIKFVLLVPFADVRRGATLTNVQAPSSARRTRIVTDGFVSARREA
jgi:hypothetical protein